MSTSYAFGYAAHYFDGTEYFDLGAGWDSAEQAEHDLRDQGCNMDGVDIYHARTIDDWKSWEPCGE